MPEVDRWLMYSPIKADRWSCGHVLQHVLDKLRKENEVFEEIAQKLKVEDPDERPSLLKLRDSVAMSSGMVKPTTRATRSRPRKALLRAKGQRRGVLYTSGVQNIPNISSMISK